MSMLHRDARAIHVVRHHPLDISAMYHLLSGLHAYLTRKDEYSVVIIGLDNVRRLSAKDGGDELTSSGREDGMCRLGRSLQMFPSLSAWNSTTHWDPGDGKATRSGLRKGKRIWCRGVMRSMRDCKVVGVYDTLQLVPSCGRLRLAYAAVSREVALAIRGRGDTESLGRTVSLVRRQEHRS